MREARRANPTAPLLARAAHDDEELLSRLGATVAVASQRAGAELLIEQALRLIELAASAQRQPG